MTNKFDLNSVINNEDGLSKEERIARLQVLEKMATLARPLNLYEVDLSHEMIKVLVKKDKIVLNNEGDKISFCYPVSGEQTSHVVELDDGRVFNSMCAIDALGASFTFGLDLTINSKCSVSGKDIKIRIENGTIVNKNADDIYAIHMNLNDSDNWAASCWNHMNFFRGKENLDYYYRVNELEGSAYGLDLEKAFLVGKKIFSVEETLKELEEKLVKRC